MVKIRVKDLAVRYGDKEALKGISLVVPAHEIIAIIGPAGSGKTSFLKALNRTLPRGATTSGRSHMSPAGPRDDSDDRDDGCVPGPSSQVLSAKPGPGWM